MVLAFLGPPGARCPKWGAFNCPKSWAPEIKQNELPRWWQQKACDPLPLLVQLGEHPRGKVHETTRLAAKIFPAPFYKHIPLNTGISKFTVNGQKVF